MADAAVVAVDKDGVVLAEGEADVVVLGLQPGDAVGVQDQLAEFLKGGGSMVISMDFKKLFYRNTVCTYVATCKAF